MDLPHMPPGILVQAVVCGQYRTGSGLVPRRDVRAEPELFEPDNPVRQRIDRMKAQGRVIIRYPSRRCGGSWSTERLSCQVMISGSPADDRWFTMLASAAGIAASTTVLRLNGTQESIHYFLEHEWLSYGIIVLCDGTECWVCSTRAQIAGLGP
jgi:hypothetical protein